MYVDYSSTMAGLLSIRNTSSHTALNTPRKPVYTVQNDVLQAVDHGECVFLVLLDLSAAFDTVSHDLLLRRL